jgi:ComF family protein
MSAPVNQDAGGPVDGWLARLGRVVFPPRCLVCREPGRDGRDLCLACAAALPWNRSACTRCALPLPGPQAGNGLAPWCGTCLQRASPLAAAHAAFLYAFPVDRLLPRFKFHQDLAAGRLLAGLMADAFHRLPPPDALLPVPLHASRLRQRGYDQALELAQPLGRLLCVPIVADGLARCRATAAQSKLDAPARRRNLRGAFAVPGPGVLPDHVALVDDVMTTGATLHAAAAALRAAGVRRIDAWVCARAP